MNNKLYLIYDKECYFCNHTAKALKIKKAVGELILINARENHPLITEALEKGFDINEGIIVSYQQKFYYGKKAIHLLNLLDNKTSFYEKWIAKLYKNKLAISLGYPILKMLRNVNLMLQGKTKIKNQAFPPIFQPIFGETWERLPTVIKRHYANRPYSKDITRAKGQMTITFSPLLKALAPFLSYFKIFAPAEGKNIPVEVDYLSRQNDTRFIFDRRFYYPHLTKPFEFKSTLWQVRDNIIIDTLRFGLGMKFIYRFDSSKIKFIHCGYALVIGKLKIPLPLSFLLGKGYGEETPLSDTSFHFFLESTHPLFGKIIRYEGIFNID